jgi:hypothetical protein
MLMAPSTKTAAAHEFTVALIGIEDEVAAADTPCLSAN